MAYCADHAVPHSVFLGRVVAAGESAWLPEDRAKLMAWLLEKATICTRCGVGEWEWQDDDGAYEPTLRYCHVCYLMGRFEEGNRGETSVPGMVAVAVPRAVAARMRNAPKKRPTRRRKRRD